MFFHTVFFVLSLFQALASHLDQRIQWANKGKGKGRVKEGKGKNRKGRGKGKGKEKERERKGKRKGKKRKRKGKGKEQERKRKRERKRKGKRKGEGKGRVKEKGKERERKGRGKGEEKEKRAVSHTDHFWCQWLQSSKKECSDHLPGTFRVQNLKRIRWRTIPTTNNEMKKPKTLNSFRKTEK